jgi:UDP-glucose 4-epimerase
MNVLVTGSHGYIGSVLCKVLTEAGHNVVAVDNKKFLGGDFRYFRTVYHHSFDSDMVANLVITEKIEVIYHLAATSLVGPDALDPIEYYWNNVSHTTNMVHKLIERGWKGRIVFASTAAVYSPQSNMLGRPFDEYSQVDPASVYGRTKLICEDVLKHATKYGIKTSIFRFFNVAGAVDDLGEEHEDTHLISRICHAALGHSDMKVYGDNFDTPDGTCIRDYVHVLDVCRAMMCYRPEAPLEVYNLGTGQGASVKQVIDFFTCVTGIDVPYEVVRRRAGDVSTLVADGSAFKRDTGFQYQHSFLVEIIETSWEYFRSKNGV